MEQYTLNFKRTNGFPSQCQILIYRKSNIVIATDIDQGMSVTNACAIIANAVVEQYEVNPQTMTFIEQYRPGRADQTTDLVQFDFADGKAFRHPNWIHIPREKFDEIMAKAIELE
jgi:hypothetical protein